MSNIPLPPKTDLLYENSFLKIAAWCSQKGGGKRRTPPSTKTKKCHLHKRDRVPFLKLKTKPIRCYYNAKKSRGHI